MPTLTTNRSTLSQLLVVSLWLVAYVIICSEANPPPPSSSIKSLKSSTWNNVTMPTTISSTLDDNDSFSSVYELNDGEIVTKLRWRNYSAIETRYRDMDLIQITKDDNQIIQFWFSKQELIDCEFTNDKKTIENFHHEFHKINPNMHKDWKTFKLLEKHKNLDSSADQPLPENLKRLVDFEKHELECQQLHRKIQKHFQSKSPKRKRLSIRNKRDLLVFPGTNWCGKGSNSKEFEDLGDYSFADRCCRDHDLCKYSIGPFESQYHLFNYGFHYVSHCSCDERFRSCLKVADSGAANLVGKIYFNVVKTKCFLFKMEDMCVERAWWGVCTKTKRRKRAVFRDPLAY